MFIQPQARRSAPILKPAIFAAVLDGEGKPLAFLNKDGSIKTSDVKLQGIDAAAHIDKMSKKDISALSFADRAELIRQLVTNASLDRKKQVKLLLRLYRHFELPEKYLSDLAAATRAFHSQVESLIGQHETGWASKKQSEKQAVFEEIHRLHAKHFGFEEASLVYKDKFDKPASRRGYYDGQTETINLVGQDLPTLRQGAWTLFHEGLHRRQHNMIYDLENAAIFDPQDEKQQMALLFHLECVRDEAGYIQPQEDEDSKYVPSEREASMIDSVFAKRAGIEIASGRLQY